MKNSVLAYPVILLLAAGLLGCQQSGGGGRLDSGRAGGPSAAAPRSTPRPTPVPVVLPEGTRLPLELRTTLSTASSRPGDAVVAVLREDVRANGRVALRAGSELRGRVTTAVRSGKVKGRARLVFQFDEVQLRGRAHALETAPIDISADPSKKRDAALIGGGAAGGAIVGGIADGKKGAGIGALLGAAAGTGAVLVTRGKEVQLPAGTLLSPRLSAPLAL